MSTVTYASIAPRIYAFKSKLLDETRITELIRVAGIEDFIRLLKDTRYSGIIGNIQDIEKISMLVEGKILEEKLMLENISVSTAKQVIKYLNIIEEIKELVSIIKTFVNEGSAGLDKYSSRKFMPSASSIIEMLREYSYDAKEKSVQNIVKRAVEFIEDREVKKMFSLAITDKDIQENIALLEFKLVSIVFKELVNIIEGSKNYTGIDLKELLCPYVDYVFTQTLTNLLMINRNIQLGQTDVFSRATCSLSEALKTAISTNSTIPLYQKLITVYGLPQIKRDNIGELDEQIEVEVFKKIKRKAQRSFQSYPFTPSLAVSAYMLLEIERKNLMRTIAILETVKRTKGYENMFIILA